MTEFDAGSSIEDIAPEGSKVHHVERSTIAIRFERDYRGGGREEFDALNRLYSVDPGHVVKPLALTQENGITTGYDTELIEGITASEYLDRHKAIPPAIEDQIRGALAKFHENGLAHGDPNKGNVIITEDGVPKFIDPVGYGEIPGQELDQYVALDLELLNEWLTTNGTSTRFNVRP